MSVYQNIHRLQEQNHGENTGKEGQEGSLKGPRIWASMGLCYNEVTQEYGKGKLKIAALRTSGWRKSTKIIKIITRNQYNYIFN